MDTPTLIRNLHRLFSRVASREKKYILVWLEQAYEGGLYFSGKFILNVQLHPSIEITQAELGAVYALLSQQAREDLRSIWKVVLHHGGRSPVPSHCV